MKEEYIKPVVEVENYKTADVITTSGKIGLDDEGWIDKWY